MMLTSDISLLEDPTKQYPPLVKKYAEDQAAFDHAFKYAWYKLTTRDMGPVTRCVGKNVPPAQDWQYPLPPTPAKLANFDQVRKDLEAALTTDQPSILPADKYGKGVTYGPLFVRLAWQCASTFRSTDYQGGCNGARIRYR
jgi:catalase (peroxidase I)